MEDSASTQLAQVLKHSLSSSEPVEQIQLISKVRVYLHQVYVYYQADHSLNLSYLIYFIGWLEDNVLC